MDTKNLTVDELNYPFVECATFADYVKYIDGQFQILWHFEKTPYLDRGDPISKYKISRQSMPLSKAVVQIISWLRKDPGYQNLTAYLTLKMHYPNDKQAESYALRLLIHYIGDVH